jgi:hypothetical protein
VKRPIGKPGLGWRDKMKMHLMEMVAKTTTGFK